MPGVRWPPCSGWTPHSQELNLDNTLTARGRLVGDVTQSDALQRPDVQRALAPSQLGVTARSAGGSLY